MQPYSGTNKSTEGLAYGSEFKRHVLEDLWNVLMIMLQFKEERPNKKIQAIVD